MQQYIPYLKGQSQTNELLYTRDEVILELPGYRTRNITRSSKGQYATCRRGLEAKTKATWREVSHLSELQKGAMKRKLLKKYNKLSIPEALGTVKH